jgi:hypothetical protein
MRPASLVLDLALVIEVGFTKPISRMEKTIIETKQKLIMYCS